MRWRSVAVLILLAGCRWEATYAQPEPKVTCASESYVQVRRIDVYGDVYYTCVPVNTAESK